MDNNTLQLKISQRLNKLSSFDYDNIEPWQIAEAFNKAQVEFVRNQLLGKNLKQEGDESSKQLTDDLQPLLKDYQIKTTNHPIYVETSLFPKDYLAFKRVSASADTECCKDRRMLVNIHPVADVDVLLRSDSDNPDFEWAETFGTLMGNRIRIYHNGKFTLKDVSLTYYRFPRKLTLAGGVDLLTGEPTTDVTCEFKDDIAEILADKTAMILASDVELFNQRQMLSEQTQMNT